MTTPVPAPDHHRLPARLADIERRFARLDGQAAELTRRDAELVRTVGLAKGRLERRERVEQVLVALQDVVNERSVGLFSRLLTALVRDVLPGDRSIVCETGIERGSPVFDIMVERNGHREDVYDGSGGSLTNIVTAGIRLIALVRSHTRPFAALDEPDCWLEPQNVPPFIRVLSRMAKEVGVQLLLISHHDLSSCPDLHVVRLEGTPDTGLRAVAPQPEFPDDGKQRLTGIRLRNVWGHVDSYIPLSPYVTVLTGANNIGKSGTLAGLRGAWRDAGAKDGLVRHGESEAQVDTFFSDGQRVEWIYRHSSHRKTKPARTWRLVGADDAVLQESSGRGLPPWLDAVIGMPTLDDLDLHVSHQKQPIFLLDQPGARRAAILSAGQEGGYVQAMIAQYRSDLTGDRDTVAKGEVELSNLRRRREGLVQLDQLRPQLDGHRQTIEALRTREQAAAHLAQSIDQLRGLSAKVHRLTREIDLLTGIEGLDIPELKSVTSLEQDIAALRRLEGRARALAPLAALELPDVPDELRPASALAADIVALRQLKDQGRQLSIRLDEDAAELDRLQHQLEDALAALDHHCPLCGGPLTAEQLEGKHAHP